MFARMTDFATGPVEAMSPRVVVSSKQSSFSQSTVDLLMIEFGQ